MLPRVLEPEVMDSEAEAIAYDAMDHREVNSRFVADLLAFLGPTGGGEWLDVGSGTAQIPILLCQKAPGFRIRAVDLAEEMLALARRNVVNAGLEDRIRTERVDSKALPYPDGSFEAVLSNSIIHHIPDPMIPLAEMVRVVAPGGSVFVRDLARPASQQDLERLVETHAKEESEHARALFQASLHAALTVSEVAQMLRALGLPEQGVRMTSDRHWTWTWRRPENQAL